MYLDLGKKHTFIDISLCKYLKKHVRNVLLQLKCTFSGCGGSPYQGVLDLGGSPSRGVFSIPEGSPSGGFSIQRGGVLHLGVILHPVGSPSWGGSPSGGVSPFRGGSPSWGVSIQGVSIFGGLYLGGFSIQGGSPLGGVPCDISRHAFDVTCMLPPHQLRHINSAPAYILLPGHVTCKACWDTHPPPCGQTHTCKNITFTNYICGR